VEISCLDWLLKENGGMGNKRKTKTNDDGLDDVRWIWKTLRRGRPVRLLAMWDICDAEAQNPSFVAS